MGWLGQYVAEVGGSGFNASSRKSSDCYLLAVALGMTHFYAG